jgi:hypothetical protein
MSVKRDSGIRGARCSLPFHHLPELDRVAVSDGGAGNETEPAAQAGHDAPMRQLQSNRPHEYIYSVC